MLSVIMPVYNEHRTLREVLERVLAVPVPMEIIIVDDGSTDGTRELLKSEIADLSPCIRIIFHEQNAGKGAAIRTAIPLAQGAVCMIQDADLEYDPQDYPKLVRPILEGQTDVVYGSRFLGRGKQKEQTIQHYLANRLLTFLSNALTRLKLTDMETCYKVARTELLQSLKLESNGFDIEPEITARLASARARFIEVPITYHARGYGDGKKIGWRDGIHTLAAIFRYGRRR